MKLQEQTSASDENQHHLHQQLLEAEQKNHELSINLTMCKQEIHELHVTLEQVCVKSFVRTTGFYSINHVAFTLA